MRSSSTDSGPATLIPWGTLRLRLTLLNTAGAAIVIALLLLAVRAGVRAALFRTADEDLRAAVRETTLALREIEDLGLVVDALRRKSDVTLSLLGSPYIGYIVVHLAVSRRQ